MRVPWNRGGLRTWLLAIGLIAGYMNPYSIALGVPFVLAGIGLHLWAKGCLHRNKEITISGPYRFVRHPFYLANAILDTGIAVMTGWWLIVLVLPIWWCAVYMPTIRKEESLLIGLHGNAYRAYRRLVPMLLPYRPPVRRRTAPFSWRNPALSKSEASRALRYLFYVPLFFIAYRFHASGLEAILAPKLVDVTAVAACCALYGMSMMLVQHFNKQRPICPAWITTDGWRFVLLLAVIGVGMYVTRYEVEADWLTWPPGLALLALSTITRHSLSDDPSIAEALMAVGLAVLFELYWLGLVIAPVYLAIVLDRRLTAGAMTEKGSSVSRYLSTSSFASYSIVLFAGILMALAKEGWL